MTTLTLISNSAGVWSPTLVSIFLTMVLSHFPNIDVSAEENIARFFCRSAIATIVVAIVGTLAYFASPDFHTLFGAIYAHPDADPLALVIQWPLLEGLLVLGWLARKKAVFSIGLLVMLSLFLLLLSPQAVQFICLAVMAASVVVGLLEVLQSHFKDEGYFEFLLVAVGVVWMLWVTRARCWYLVDQASLWTGQDLSLVSGFFAMQAAISMAVLFVRIRSNLFCGIGTFCLLNLEVLLAASLFGTNGLNVLSFAALLLALGLQIWGVSRRLA